MIWRVGGGRGCCRSTAPSASLPLSGRRGDGSGAAVPVALAVLGTARPGERGDGAAAAAGHVSGAMGPGAPVGPGSGRNTDRQRCLCLCGAGSRVLTLFRGSVLTAVQLGDKESLAGGTFNFQPFPRPAAWICDPWRFIDMFWMVTFGTCSPGQVCLALIRDLKWASESTSLSPRLFLPPLFKKRAVGKSWALCSCTSLCFLRGYGELYLLENSKRKIRVIEHQSGQEE